MSAYWQKGNNTKMKKIITLTGMLALLVSLPVSANLLTNPDFEAGDTSGWTLSWGDIYSDVANPQAGANHARNWWTGDLFQEVAVTAGEQYGLSAWGYVPSGGDAGGWGTYISMDFMDSGGGSLASFSQAMETLPRDQYNQFDTGLQTAPAGTVSAKVSMGTWASGSPANPTDFDNFDIYQEAIPEPASITMLGIAGLALCALQRRKQRQG